jgi:hypothetical protein
VQLEEVQLELIEVSGVGVPALKRLTLLPLLMTLPLLPPRLRL